MEVDSKNNDSCKNIELLFELKHPVSLAEFGSYSLNFDCDNTRNHKYNFVNAGPILAKI